MHLCGEVLSGSSMFLLSHNQSAPTFMCAADLSSSFQNSPMIVNWGGEQRCYHTSSEVDPNSSCSPWGNFVTWRTGQSSLEPTLLDSGSYRSKRNGISHWRAASVPNWGKKTASQAMWPATCLCGKDQWGSLGTNCPGFYILHRIVILSPDCALTAKSENSNQVKYHEAVHVFPGSHSGSYTICVICNHFGSSPRYITFSEY